MPSATHVCAPAFPLHLLPPIYIAYAAPADGGDIYVVCFIPPGYTFTSDPTQEPFSPGELRVSDPSGTVLFEVQVDAYEEMGVVDLLPGGGEIGYQMVATYPSGSRRAHGIHHMSQDITVGPKATGIPFFLPHDRLVGTWAVDYRNDIGEITNSFEIDGACFDGTSRTVADPLNWASTIAVFGSADADGRGAARGNPIAPPPFEHCRLVPDVTGMLVGESVNLLEQWAVRHGKTPQTEVITGECPDGLTDDIFGQSPLQHFIYRRQIFRRVMGFEIESDFTQPITIHDGQTC